MSAVEHFVKALQFKTISRSDKKDIDEREYLGFINFLESSYPLIHKKLERKIINDYGLIFHWKTPSEVKPILLTAHYDVVEVNPSDWRFDPFSGQIVEDRIYGRGAIDDKNSVIGLMEAVESLLNEGFEPKQDIYLAFGFDEENHGLQGAKQIVAYFMSQGIRFQCSLDEGGAVTSGASVGVSRDVAVIGLAEKGNSNFEFTFIGEEGHSSAPPQSTSIGKMARFIKDVEDHPRQAKLVEPVISMLKTLAKEKKGIERLALSHPEQFFPLIKGVLEKGKQTRAMLRSSVSFTMTEGGQAPNILPKTASCVANVRMLPGDRIQDIERWFKSFKHDFTMKPLFESEASKVTNTDQESFKHLKRTIEQFFPDTIVTEFLMIGGTDSIHYDKVSDAAYRFMPCYFTNEELGLMHASNEYIKVETFLKMIEFYKYFIKEFV
ncbi:M20/M25/M40 family metallo-hydrolase [Guggenheimella bovis]